MSDTNGPGDSLATYERADFARDRLHHLDTLKRRCAKCSSTDGWAGLRCQGCKGSEAPGYVCHSCDVLLVDDGFEYRAVSSGGNSFTAWLPGDSCPACRRMFVHSMFTEELDEFIEEVPTDLRVLPEVGIQLADRMEIFVEVPEREPVELRSAVLPITVSLGPQTELFQRCLDHITRFDTGDYGHDASCTLTVSPAPPYNDAQRRELHLLLSQLTREVGGAPHFWSRDFDPSEGDFGSSSFGKLLAIVETWRLDQDRTALSLVIRAEADSGQGTFVNVFRLLELVLRRCDLDDLERARFDKTRGQDEFMKMVRSMEWDLAARLRKRVKSLSRPPHDALSSLWAILVPAKGYNSDEVFNLIAKLRNRSVHSPAEDEALVLPWEEVSFARLAELVGALTAEIVARFEEDVSSEARGKP